jgi:chromatin modification-related protein EAF6
MAENVPPAGGASGSNGDVPGQPFYDKARNHLKDLIERRNKLQNNLGTLEDRIYKEETDYLEGTPSGNIIKGFENYTKGTGSSAPGQRRRVPVNNEDRLFSRSSHTYNLNAVSFVLSSLSNGEGRC